MPTCLGPSFVLSFFLSPRKIEFSSLVVVEVGPFLASHCHKLTGVPKGSHGPKLNARQARNQVGTHGMATVIPEHECWGRLKRDGGTDNTGTLPEEVLLKNEETVIGREKKANVDYAFGAAYISSRHLKVGKSSVTSAEDDVPADEYHVIDTSRNGTFVLHAGAEQPVRCEPGVPHHISEGDQILFMFKSELKAVYVVRISTCHTFVKYLPPDTQSLFSVILS